MYGQMEAKPGISEEMLKAAKAQMESLLASLHAVLIAQDAATKEEEEGRKPARSLARLHSNPDRDAAASKKPAVSSREQWADAPLQAPMQLENPPPPSSQPDG